MNLHISEHDLEDDMALKIPSNIFIARAHPANNGKFHALFAAPGLIPEVSVDARGRPLEFDNERDAEARAANALISTLNKPRQRATDSPPEHYKRLTGPELAVMLATVKITPTFFAYLYGTSQKRVLKWIDGAEDVPHNVRPILQSFIEVPKLVDLWEKVADEVATLKKPAKED